MTSLSSIVSTANSVIANRPATTKASDELQSLFAKLHMDAIASTSATSTATTAAATPAATTTSASDGVTGLVSGLRSVLDGAVSAASAARSVAKSVGIYASGAGVAGLALHAVNKLA